MVPVGIAFFYFIGGVRMIIVGSKDKIKSKKVVGYNVVFISMTVLTAIIFGWLWLCRVLLRWEF
jgi:hypothetical protein